MASWRVRPAPTLWAWALRRRVADNLERCLRIRACDKPEWVIIDLLGVCRQHLTDIRACRVSVGLDLHADIAAALEVDGADLFGELPEGLPRAEPRRDPRHVVAHNFKAAMRRCRLNPQSLAALAGIGKTTVYDILNAAVGVHYDSLAAITAALGAAPADLVRVPAPMISFRDRRHRGQPVHAMVSQGSRDREARDAVQL